MEQTARFLKVSQHADLFDAWILSSLESVPQSYFENFEFLNTFSSRRGEIDSGQPPIELYMKVGKEEEEAESFYIRGYQLEIILKIW